MYILSFLALLVVCLTPLGAARGLVIDEARFVDTSTSIISSASPLVVRGNNAPTVVYDANGRSIYFPMGASTGSIIVGQDKKLVLQNAVLIGFVPGCVTLQSPTSSFVLGDNVVVSLDRDLDVVSPLAFAGSAVINGNGKVLHLREGGAVGVLPGASLEIKDCVLRGLRTTMCTDGARVSSLACTASTSTLVLNQVRCFFDDSWEFSVGSLRVANDVTMTSSWATVAYTSALPLTINARSSLKLDRGITLALSGNASKNTLVFADATATLMIKNSALAVGDNGLALTAGTLFLKGNALFKTASIVPAQGITLDQTLFAAILSGSQLSVDGIISHGQPSSAGDA